MILSIITPTLNRARYLGAAIESVLAQDFEDFEHIVVDGVSTDDTPELLARHPHLRVIREPDDGLYDAVNKGLRAARGEFVGLLNSDDLYAPGALRAVVAACEYAEVVTGGAEFFDGEKIVRSLRAAPELELNLRNVLAGTPLVNARFFRRTFLERVGGFDPAFPIAADRDFLVRAALTAPREKVLPALFYRYRQHEDSLTVHDTERNVIGYREQHVALAEKNLAADGLPGAARAQLRTFHARECAAVAAVHLRQGRGGTAWQWAKRGCAQNALWPLSFARRLAGQALGR